MGFVNKMNTVKVSVYGKQYNIAGEASQGDILRYAKYVDEKLENLMGGRTKSLTVDLMILASLNIAEDLFAIKAERDEVLDTVFEKDKESEGYNNRWDDNEFADCEYNQDAEALRDEIINLERERDLIAKEAEEAKSENAILKEANEALKQEIENLKNMHIQMQLFIPETSPESDDDTEEIGGTVTPKKTAAASGNRKKKKNKHKKKR